MPTTKEGADLLGSFSSKFLYSRPKLKDDYRVDYYKEQEEELSWAIDQGVARNLIDPVEAEEAKAGNEKTWWDRAFGFNEGSKSLMGAWAQPLIDVLSVGNYAAAAVTKGTMKDPLFQIGSVKIGATPAAFLEAFKTRPYYTDMFESFGAGLAFDIALDPITYLTFGTGAGHKIGVGGLKNVGKKSIPVGKQKLTMTRFGGEIYHLAAKRKRVKITEALELAQAEAKASGKGVKYHLDAQKMLSLHDELGQYMVNNFDVLKHDYQKQLSRFGKFKQFMKGEGFVAGQKLGDASPQTAKTVEDLFRETTTYRGRDIGVDFSATGQWLTRENTRRSLVFKAVIPSFHRKFNVPLDVQDQHFITQGVIRAETSNRLLEIEQALAHHTRDDLHLLTRVLESGDQGISRHHDDLQKTMAATLLEDGTYLSPELMKTKEWIRTRFDEILERERAAGHATDSVRDYVQRIFKTKDARRIMMHKVSNHPGKSKFNQPNSFQMHRTIANLDEHIQVFGQGMKEENIATILANREAQSIRMMEMEKFYDYVKLTSGYAPLIVYQIGNEGRRVSSMLKKMLKMQRPKDNRLIEFDQFLSQPDTMAKKFGFITDPDAYKSDGAIRNLDLMQYLSLPFAERQTKSGSAIARNINPNYQAQSGKTINRKFKYKRTKGGEKSVEEIDFIDLMRAEYDPVVGGAPGLWEILERKFGVETVTPSEVVNFIKQMDRYTRRELDAPLLHLFPDIVSRVKQGAVESKRLGKKALKAAPEDRILKGGKRGPAPMFKKLEKELRREVSTHRSFVPQLPEEFIIKAKVARMRSSDFTDVSRPNDNQFKRIDALRKKLGMKGDHLQEITHALTGKRAMNTLVGREADRLIELLGIHAGEFSARKGAVSGSLFGGSVTKVTWGQRGVPQFDNMSTGLRESIEQAEQFSVAKIARLTKSKRFDRQIKEGREQLAKLTDELAEAEEQLAKRGYEGYPGMEEGGPMRSIGGWGDRVKNLKERIRAAEASIDDAARGKRNLPTGSETVGIMDDTRQHIGTKEILKRNGGEGGRLTDAEQEIVGRKYGVVRQTQDARKLVKSEDYAEASKVHKWLVKSLKENEPNIKEWTDEVARLTEKVDEMEARIGKVFGEISEEAATRPLERSFFKATNELDVAKRQLKAFSEDRPKMLAEIALSKLNKTSKVKILSGGRYLDANGKVRDILVRQSRKGKLTIMGKDREHISRALSADIVKNGRSNLEFYQPALAKELPVNIVGSGAQSYWVPDDIARFLNELVEPLYKGDNPMIDGMLRGYDWIQNLFKVPLLAPWFSTMARNGIGNVSIAYMKAGAALANPEYLSDYMKVLQYTLARESPTYKNVLGKFGVDEKVKALGEQTVNHLGAEDGVKITIAELVDELGKRGVFTSWMRNEVYEGARRLNVKGGGKQGGLLPATGGEMVGGAAMGAGIGGSLGGPIGAGIGGALGALLGKETHTMRYAFRGQELASEIPTRLMLGLHSFKQTGSFNEAGRVTRHFLHDYNELSTFEKRIMRRVIPFYNFTKLAFRVVGTQFFENPGRLLQPWKIFNSQNITGANIFEPGAGAASPEDVPDWFHKQMVFMGKNIDEESGKVKSWVYSGFNLPIQEVLQLTDIVAPGGEPITKFGSRTSFLATSVAEYMTNYDSFRGGPIRPDVKAGVKITQWQSGNAWKQSPPWLQKLVGYAEGPDGVARVNPTYAWLMGEIPTSRFVSLVKKLYEISPDDSKKIDYTGLAGRFLGVNVYKYDEKTQQYFRNRAKVDALTAVLANVQLLKSYDIDRSVFDRPKKRKLVTPPGLIGQGPLE